MHSEKQIDGKTPILTIIVLLAPILLGACLLFGPSQIGLPDMNTMAGQQIFFLRLNRVIAGFFVGAALACAGVVFQALLRNPLAEPYILGVSSGAGLGAAVAILSGLAGMTMFALPVSAFLAGGITLFIVYKLASQDGGPSVYGLILSGVIVSAICSSIIMCLVSLSSIEGMHSVIWWMLGNLQGIQRNLLRISATIIAAGCITTWFIAPELNALTLGHETAHNVGVRTKLIVVLGLGLSTVITAAAVGMSGLIGFVGLIVPHVMRNLAGPDHRRLIPLSAIAGGTFLAICDAAARTVTTPFNLPELPVGVITAICGGPFFLLILRRKRRTWTG